MIRHKVTSKNKKILVIPDVHYKFGEVRRILSKEYDYDRVVFLGDFFDFWGDNEEDTQRCCFAFQNLFLELEEKKKKFNILWGNHDLSYAWGYRNEYSICPGWNHRKSEASRQCMSQKDWNRFQWYLFIDDDILLTHAGLTNEFLKDGLNNNDIESLLRLEARKAERSLLKNKFHWFYGSIDNIGGILWNRPNMHKFKFSKIKGLRQIFGHTYQGIFSWCEDENYCIDTALKHYALINNGNIEIKQNV